MTLDDLKMNVSHAVFFTARDGADAVAGGGATHHEALGRTMICTVVMKDGPVFVGAATAISQEHFDVEVMQESAYETTLGNAYEAITAQKAYADPLAADGHPDTIDPLNLASEVSDLPQDPIKDDLPVVRVRDQSTDPDEGDRWA
jgi:hypothetical protein